MVDKLTVGEVMLAEYDKLKDEEQERIRTCHGLIAAMATAAAAAAGFAYQLGTVDTLLVVPGAALVLGWTYLINEERAAEASRHIRQVLGPLFRSRLGTDVAVFGWEARRRRGGRWRRATQVGVNLLLFCGPASGAMVVWWLQAPARPPLRMVAYLDSLLAVATAAMIVAFAIVVRPAKPTAAGP